MTKRSLPGLGILIFLAVALALCSAAYASWMYVDGPPPLPSAPAARNDVQELRAIWFLVCLSLTAIGTLVALVATSAHIASRGRYAPDAKTHPLMRVGTAGFALFVLAILSFPLLVQLKQNRAVSRRAAILADDELKVAAMHADQAKAAEKVKLQGRLQLVADLSNSDPQRRVRTFEYLADHTAEIPTLPPDAKAQLVTALNDLTPELLTTEDHMRKLASIYSFIAPDRAAEVRIDWQNNRATYLDVNGWDADKLARASAKSSDFRELLILIDRGYKAAQHSPGQLTSVLADAVAAGQARVVAAMLDHGVSPNEIGPYESPLILKACIKPSQAPTLRVLLEHGADVELTAVNNPGWTATNYAAGQHNLEALEVLIEFKANLNMIANDGRAPLDRVNDYGGTKDEKAAVAEFLIAHGAKHAHEIPKYAGHAPQTRPAGPSASAIPPTDH